MELTTPEIIRALQKAEFEKKESIKILKQVLDIADMVKFARYEALPNENDMALMNAFLYVNQTKIEVVKSLEEQRAEMTKINSNQNNTMEVKS